MISEDVVIEDLQLTREEFFKKNKGIIDKYAIPIDKANLFMSGCVGNDDDCDKLNFGGVYVLLENNKVFYIGSALPNGRTIKDRYKEHKYGHYTNSKIVRYLMNTRNLDINEARNLVKTFDFIAFKYKSFEYELINETPGLINHSGNYSKVK